MTRLLPRIGFLFVSLGVSTSLGACAGSSDEAVESASHAVERTDPAANGTRLRVVAGNLSSGNYQNWDPGEGIRMLRGLAPDIAVLQEFTYRTRSPDDYQAFLAAAFDSSFFYTVESAQLPNGIVSRYPIIDHGVWDDPAVSNRNFVWARIDVPGDKDLWAISVHLLTTGAPKRQAEADALVHNIRNLVPESDYVIIGGDFNTGSRTEGCLQTFGGITRTTAPFPVDSNNKGGTSASRKKPLDWVIASPGLDAREIPVEIGQMTFEHGLVFDSRDFPDLAAVAPVQRSDSAAMNMQHMPVVRDFALPN